MTPGNISSVILLQPDTPCPHAKCLTSLRPLPGKIQITDDNKVNIISNITTADCLPAGKWKNNKGTKKEEGY